MIVGASVLFGQGNADDARVWRLQRGADDGGTDFEVYALSSWISPAAGGGTCVFYTAFVTMTWSAPMLLRFTPVVDNDPDVVSRPGGTLEVLPIEVPLPDPGSGRRTTTFRVPLVRLVMDGAIDLGRNAVSGTRLRLQLETVGGLGGGDLILDGVEIEYEQIPDDKRSEG